MVRERKGWPGRAGPSPAVGRRVLGWPDGVAPGAIFRSRKERTNPIAALTVTRQLAAGSGSHASDRGAHSAPKLPRSFASRRGEDIGRRALLTRSSVAEEANPSEMVPREFHLVSDHQHRQVVLGRQLADDTPSPPSPVTSGSSADVTSSKSITRGRIASARAIATRCCWPPDSAVG